MEQIRPFPPTDFIDQAEEEEAIRLLPAPDLKKWVVANYLTIGVLFIIQIMIILLSCFMIMTSFSIRVGLFCI